MARLRKSNTVRVVRKPRKISAKRLASIKRRLSQAAKNTYGMAPGPQHINSLCRMLYEAKHPYYKVALKKYKGMCRQ